MRLHKTKDLRFCRNLLSELVGESINPVKNRCFENAICHLNELIVYTEKMEKEIKVVKSKSYEVFYTVGSVQHKTAKVYRGLGAARKDAKRIATLNGIYANHIHIVGYDDMAHRNFREIIR